MTTATMNRTDAEIKESVNDQLFWDNRFDATDITVEVNDGTVTLTGTVLTYFGRQAAESSTWVVSGVTDVRNQLVVDYPETMVPSDEEIRVNIVDLFARNSDVDTSEIDVYVDEGLVILEGTVDAYWKKEYLRDLIVSVNGVADIDNKVTVVPTENVVDKKIANDVMAALERNIFVDTDDIDVTVKDGEVTLEGTVYTWKTTEEANKSALFTDGVVEVHNNLIVNNEH